MSRFWDQVEGGTIKGRRYPDAFGGTIPAFGLVAVSSKPLSPPIGKSAEHRGGRVAASSLESTGSRDDLEEADSWKRNAVLLALIWGALFISSPSSVVQCGRSGGGRGKGSGSSNTSGGRGGGGSSGGGSRQRGGGSGRGGRDAAGRGGRGGGRRPAPVNNADEEEEESCRLSLGIRSGHVRFRYCRSRLNRSKKRNVRAVQPTGIPYSQVSNSTTV
uniref:Uncharacterized protein n=1 Tax=Globodera rostochiensis TaxID=31243 RepID=A0A914HZ80_GLORO